MQEAGNNHNNTPTMSSRETVDDHILRDIRKMLNELEVPHLNFEGSYRDASSSTAITLKCWSRETANPCETT